MVKLFRIPRRNITAVVLCVLAATIFWFLNALNKTYTTNINYPLEFSYDKASFLPAESLPEEVRLNVSGTGWALFRKSAGLNLMPLEIPLEKPAEVKKIIGSTLTGYFAGMVSGIEIKQVLTDTLYVNLQPKAARWISLKVDSADLYLRPGYGITSRVGIFPDSIFLEGPQSLIDQFLEPVGVRLPFRNIDETFSEDVEITIPSTQYIRRDPPTVKIMFNVERFRERTDSVRLRIDNLPSNVWPVLGKKKIVVRYQIPAKSDNKSLTDSITAVIDASSIAKGKHTIVPRIQGLPEYSKLVFVDSVRIDF